MEYKIRYQLFINLFLILINLGFYQGSVHGIGLGGSMVTLSQGVSSIGINPANLAYSKPSINLINFNSYFFTNLISLKLYNSLNGSDLEDVDSPISKNEFLNLLGSKALNFIGGLNMHIPGINFSNKNYAISTKLIQLIELKTGNKLIKTALVGNEWETEIPIEIEFISSGIIEYGFTKWHELNGFSIGITTKYLQGLNLIKLYSDSNSEPLYTDSSGINIDLLLRKEFYPGGSGFAFDLGFVTKRTESGWTLGFSVINILGYINWDKYNLNYKLFGKSITKSFGLSAYKSNVDRYRINNLDATDLMSGTIEIADSLVLDTSYVEDLSAPIYKSDYPAKFRFGFSKTIKNDLRIAMESRTSFQQVNTSPIGWVHSIGIEIIRWKSTPLRIGFSSGKNFDHNIGIGLGLHLNSVNIDVGIAWTGSRKLYTATGVDCGLSISMLR